MLPLERDRIFLFLRTVFVGKFTFKVC